MKPFPHFRQHDAMDCGPTCLRMIGKHYGRTLSMQKLREATEIGKEGVNLLGIAQAAERVGFKTLAVKVTLEKLIREAPLPCIVHWGQNHFIVVYKVKEKKNLNYFSKSKGGEIYVADPGKSLIKYSFDEFRSQWISTVTRGGENGIALLMEPKPDFYSGDDFEQKSDKKSLAGLFAYFFKYKSLIFQLFLGLLTGSIIQLILPFLTQSIVDTGIQTRNLNFIYLVLVAQLMLFLGRMSVDFIRSWILLHISTRINLSILSDFLSKLLKLPLSYFESKQTGDIMQRVGDHSRIESFLTGTSLNVLFSFFNLIIFSVVLAFYNMTIFGVFLLASVLYGIWIVVFLRQRRILDHKHFALNSKNQSMLIQLVQSVPELKLNNAAMRKRWEWENLQVADFKLT